MNKNELRKKIKVLSRRLPTYKFIDNVISIVFLHEKFSTEPPKGLCATMYHTCSYEGDLMLHKKYLECIG